MDGAPKFNNKDNKFLKYKKEIMLVLTAVFIFFAIGNFFIGDKEWVEANKTANSYKVVYEGNEIGIVYEQEDALKALEKARLQLQTEENKLFEIDKELQFYLEYSKRSDISKEEDLYNNLVEVLRLDMDSFKVKAFVLQIGNDFKVALENKDSIKEVLKKAQSGYVKDTDGFDIEFVSLPYNPSISTVEVVQKKVELENRDWKTTSNIESAQVATEDEPVETVGVEFAEDIQIMESYVGQDEIVDVDEATELITKEHEEPKTYEVQSGDVLSVIAESHNMGLSELVDMNPEVEKQRFLQIGQELTVTVPEPELSVATKEKIVYTEPVPRSTKYVENPSVYKGSNKVIDSGYDGVKEVTAIVTKVNGKEDSKEIIDETIIKQPKAKVIEKGTKPLPTKSATGTFIYPVVGARLTSPFGYRWGSFHHGIDLAISTGTPIRASDGGTVVFAGWKNSVYGYTVEIDHGKGVLTRYAHASAVTVKKGQKVAQYQTIAKVGNTGRSTGPHVHFEIRFDGVAANPMKYLR